MQNNSLFIQTISKISDCRDMEDNKFLELAKDAQAICLITGDKDLLTLKSLNQYQNLIITAREFMELY